MSRMSAPRHGRPKVSGHTGWMILALVLLLILTLSCTVLAFGLATNRISWELQPVSATPGSSTAAVTEASKRGTTTTSAPAGSVTHYKQSRAKEWNLLLVNSWNVLPDGYEEATEYIDYDGQGNRIDARVKDALLQMMNAGSDYNLWGILLYRDGETQQRYFDAAVQEWKNKGYADSEAQAMAATEVIRPGTSEHQTGLAIDILGSGYTERDEAFDQSEAFQWLQAHCAEYGFILRYPKGKEAITGMEYEPWHYRYVGVEYATEIMSRGITLEEFLEEKGF